MYAYPFWTLGRANYQYLETFRLTILVTEELKALSQGFNLGEFGKVAKIWILTRLPWTAERTHD
jgi:hypothetical protein